MRGREKEWGRVRERWREVEGNRAGEIEWGWRERGRGRERERERGRDREGGKGEERDRVS